MRVSGLLSVAWLIVVGSRLDGQATPAWAQMPPRPAYADSLPNVAQTPIPLNVAAAEAEGRAWVRRAEPCTQPGNNCGRSFPDSVGRTCVQTQGIEPVRSGEFQIGGEITQPVGPRKIWWVPMHPATGFSLVVRGRLLVSAQDSLRFESSDWARGLPDGGFFFPSGFTWPKQGHWLLVVTSGPDWGCFIT